ncbi:MAG: hypothetical protein M3490_03495 [Chloroflexota bacterium]|nr:hypothetical protein [Chloroflexota bacterium]
MRVDIVEDEHDPPRLGEGHIGQVTQGVGKVGAPPLVGHLHGAPAELRATARKRLAPPCRRYSVSTCRGRPGTSWRGSGVGREHIFHRGHEVGILVWGNAPAPDYP